MRMLRISTAVLAVFTVACSAQVPAPESSGAAPAATPMATPPQGGSTWQRPADAAANVLLAKPIPQAVVSPARDEVALLDAEMMPPIEELAQPMLRLAGFRINPDTNGSHFSYRSPPVARITLKMVADGSERVIDAPSGTRIFNVMFSPDGKRLAYTVRQTKGFELWVTDTASAQSRAITDATINSTWGDPCEWVADSSALLCRFVPSGRGAAPTAPRVPPGPTVQETSGKPAPVRTNQDMLASGYDEQLFDYYFTSQLGFVNVQGGERAMVGAPGLYETASPSPDGKHVLVARVKRPFSHLVPAADFPKDVEVWDRAGTHLKQIADLPMADTVPISGVRTGPRAYAWKPVDPATLVWVEALDNGDPANKVPHRDRIVSLSAPFSGPPVELMQTEYRYDSITFTDKAVALVTEFDRPKRWTRTWIVDGTTAPRKLWDRSAEDRYRDPGTPVMRPRGVPSAPFGQTPDRVILQAGDSIYLAGEGASPTGTRPFLDRLNMKTLMTERVFQSDETSYESVLAVLKDDGAALLTRRETRTEPPNLMVRDGATPRALTAFADPAPAFSKAEKQLLTYPRKDGIQLSATLYLPPGYQKDHRLPMIVWAYPREFTDPSAAGQVVASPNRFTSVDFGTMYMLFLTQGYAVLDSPTMPIVGAGETANDTYVEQLVASAQAAVDKVVHMGIADPDRVGIGGHSYGAFMTANLLAHSDIFRAGVAMSGAYNRTLTPFTFQNERRTFWEVPQIYAKMSPFWFADKVKEPILLFHGEMDNNQGTFPIQSERFFVALKGHGATARYITLPYEAHRYAARETLLDVTAEMFSWFDKYVKNAPSRTSQTSTH